MSIKGKSTVMKTKEGREVLPKGEHCHGRERTATEGRELPQKGKNLPQKGEGRELPQQGGNCHRRENCHGRERTAKEGRELPRKGMNCHGRERTAKEGRELPCKGGKSASRLYLVQVPAGEHASAIMTDADFLQPPHICSLNL